MLSSDIPVDVWTLISKLLINPAAHITLSQLCQNARAIYEGEERWRQLCRAIGIGRGLVEKGESWKKIYIEVMAHRKGCRMPTCYHSGVPPTNVVGDLLPSPQAVLAHCEYFRKDAPAPVPHVCPFSAGLPGLDLGLGGLAGAGTDDTDADEDDEGKMDGGDGTDLAPNDPTNPGYVPAGAPPAPALVPGGIDPNAILSSFFTMLGLPAPPAGGLNAVPVPGMPGGSAYLFPGVLAGGLPAPAGTVAPVDPAADPEVPALPTPPPIKPHLLPLSYKNRANVPHRPQVHSFLLETGSVQFERFLAGKTTLNNFPLQPQGGGRGVYTPVGIDWDEETEREWVDRCLVDVMNHPLLARAFATNPPVAELNFAIDALSFRVFNKDGVTVKDAILNMKRYLSKPLSAADEKLLCTCPAVVAGTEHPCSLSGYESRLAYICRDLFPPQRSSTGDQPKKGGVSDIWLRGVTTVNKEGRVTCALYP